MSALLTVVCPEAMLSAVKLSAYVVSTLRCVRPSACTSTLHTRNMGRHGSSSSGGMGTRVRTQRRRRTLQHHTGSNGHGSSQAIPQETFGNTRVRKSKVKW